MKTEAVNAGFVHDGMLELATLIEGYFPHHAKCIRDELTVWTMDKGTGEWHGSPRHMTETRWNRLANIVSSLAAIPGTYLGDEAKRIRLSALCIGEAARAMARHCMGGKRAQGAEELALYLVAPLFVERVA